MPKNTKVGSPAAAQGTGTQPENTTDIGSVVDSAKDAASHVMDQVRDQATERADQQKQTVASGFVSVADAVRRMSDGLREHDQGPVAHYAAELGHALGDRAERAANYLRERDIRQLMSDTEDFARRSPGVFLGTAFVLGLAASRFLKSSRPVPDYLGNRPDPSRALPPATQGSGPSSYSGSTSTAEPWTRISTADPALGSDPTTGAPSSGGSGSTRTASAPGYSTPGTSSNPTQGL